MLSRIQVQGFKSLHDVDVTLAPLVVVFGPNAVGKSNLLEAIILLSRLGTERTLRDALSPPIRGYPQEAFSLPVTGLEGLYEQDSAELSMKSWVKPNGDGEHPVKYEVTVRIDPRSGALSVQHEQLERLKSNLEPVLGMRARIESSEGQLLVRRLGEAGQPRKEALGLNHTLISNHQYDEDRYPDFAVLRREFSAWRSYYLDPRLAMREDCAPSQVDHIGSRGELIAPFLNRLKLEHPQRFRALTRVLRQTIPSIDGLDVDLDKRRGHLDVTITQNGVPLSSRVVSEGTLRILALCAIGANPWKERLIAFEEPENGVHPRRIEVIADLLHRISENDQQVLVTTHSPVLVGALVRRQREQDDGRVLVLVCHSQDQATCLRALDVKGPLFEEKDIREALSTPDEGALLTAALLRGWLDG